MSDFGSLDPILKTLGYTGPATIGVVLAAAGSYLFKNRKPNGLSLAEKGMRDELSERIDKLDVQIKELYARIEEVTKDRDRQTFMANGWYWMARQARQIAEALVVDHHLPPLSPWPSDPDPTERRV